MTEATPPENQSEEPETITEDVVAADNAPVVEAEAGETVVEASETVEAEASETVEAVAEVETETVEAEAVEVVAEVEAEASTDEAPLNPGLAFEAIKPKMRIQGVVDRVELQGAIINVGLEQKGLLHISQLSEEPVKNVRDVVTENKRITAFVLAVDKNSGRLDLTLIEPPMLTWQEIAVDIVVQGTVERIEKYGVFVNIGAERPAMIHVSELTTGYVENPGDVVKVGDAIEAKVIGVNKRKKQIDLSVRALEMAAIAEEAPTQEEETATAMEIALRRAMAEMEGNTFKTDKQTKRDKKRARRADQDDIIKRTLRIHEEG